MEPEYSTLIEETIKDLELREGTPFMHDENLPSRKIVFSFGEIAPEYELAVGLATCSMRKCNITLNPSLKGHMDEFVNVVRHEIGHAFYLKHSENPRSIMYPSIDPITQNTEEAINAFVRNVEESRTTITLGRYVFPD